MNGSEVGAPQARKARSEAILRAEGIPYIAHLPVIESEADARRRSPAEVAARFSVLVLVAAKAEGVDRKVLRRVIDERGLGEALSPKERAFFDGRPDERQRVQFLWRYEAAWVLFWALNLGDEPLGLPREICDVPLLAGTVRDRADLAVGGLRSTAELLDEADLIFRCHWAVRQARLNGQEVPGRLEPGVTMERHYALNWLIGYDEGRGWDGVPTNT